MLTYLAIFTGINAAKVFGATPGLGGVIGGATLLTGITDENPIKNIFTGEHLIAGQGGIIGVIFAVWLLSLVEKRLHKVVPNSIDIIVTPTISINNWIINYIYHHATRWIYLRWTCPRD